ncbi:MAG TPA: hypothetical protein PLV08_14420 [Flavobacteriales bacterium]|nr:hypothetical protein [Flavobacteriales bacterium]HQY00969.1 hypothetical protein [Flavobacteriales bacterium]
MKVSNTKKPDHIAVIGLLASHPFYRFTFTAFFTTGWPSNSKVT